MRGTYLAELSVSRNSWLPDRRYRVKSRECYFSLSFSFFVLSLSESSRRKLSASFNFGPALFVRALNENSNRLSETFSIFSSFVRSILLLLLYIRFVPKIIYIINKQFKIQNSIHARNFQQFFICLVTKNTNLFLGK